MNYAVLHAHTEYSTRDSLIRADDLPKLAAAAGWPACAITDHGGVEGVPAFMKACKAAGVKPIAGCELYLGCPDVYNWGKYNKEDKYSHLTVVAKNAKGFSALMTVISEGHLKYYDARRQKAIIPINLILEKLDNCIILSGCYSGPFWRKTEQAMNDLVLFQERFKDDFYLELQPHHDWSEQVDLNAQIVALSQALNIPMVVTPDCHYGHEHEEKFHDALLAVSARMSINDPKRTWKFSTKGCFLKSPKQALDDLVMSGVPADLARQSVENTARVADKCENWSWDELPVPKLPDVPGNMTDLVMLGFENLGFRGRPEYEERLSKELKTFTEAGLDKYLLLVRHCIELFKEAGAEIGPRGSVGGSLVAHCLGITPLDPVPHGLSWERFYAPGRRGWPDVDIDLDFETREKAPQILRNAFGEDNVAQISNYSTFGLRMAIRDAAKAWGVVIEDVSKLEDDKDLLKEKGKNVDVEDIPPGKELAKKSPDAIAFARMLVGRVRQYGAHAGGFVISADPLIGGRSAIVSRGKDKALVWDMEVAGELKFIKMDFLGIDSLSAIKSVGQAINVVWKDVPLQDDAVMKDFQSGYTAGVPQFLSSGLRSFIRNIRPTKFEDLVWATSAFRPGGLGQMTPEEMARRYRKDPNDILVYQEDVMALCVDIAGFTWMEADGVRGDISKSKGIEAMQKWENKFVEGAIKHSGADPELAKAFWHKLENFGRYAFNKSHATSYSWNSYRIAWAKRHYPLQTFCALLNSEENNEPIKDEAPKFGIKILAPDANKSGLKWTIEGDAIRMPLTQVEGVDLRIAKLIMRFRGYEPYKDADDLATRLKKYKFQKTMPANLFSGKMPGYNFTYEVHSPHGLYLKKDLEAFRENEKGCTKCELRGHCKKVVPIEFGKTNVMIMGEAPGKDEDRAGRPFVGRSGKLVDQTLHGLGVSGLDLTWSNAAHCAPPFVPKGVEGPLKTTRIEELSMACPWVEEELKYLRPPLILALGKRAWERLGGQGKIMKVNGTVQEINGTKVVACLHPAFILRDPNRFPDFKAAFEKFVSLYRSIVPATDEPVERRIPDEPVIKDRFQTFLKQR